MPLPAPTALHELGSLIFSNDALHLEQKVVFRALAERPVQEDKLDSNYPPAEPGALGCEPLKAAGRVANAAPRFLAT